jgi:hypothetical protein
MTRQVTHLPLPNLESDATGHWYNCLVCGEKQSFSAHTPGPAATITTAQTCTECGFEIAPILPHDHVYNGNGTVHSHKCACGKEYDADAESCGICAEAHKHFPWWIVCILEALVFGGIILLLLMRKKKAPPKKAKPLAKSEKKTADEVDDLLDQLLTEEEPAGEAPDEADELLKKFLAE